MGYQGPVGTLHCVAASLFLKKIYIGVELIYNVVLASAVQQSKSVIHRHIFTLFLYRTLQSTE